MGQIGGNLENQPNPNKGEEKKERSHRAFHINPKVPGLQFKDKKDGQYCGIKCNFLTKLGTQEGLHRY